jgi:hypothetical protein
VCATPRSRPPFAGVNYKVHRLRVEQARSTFLTFGIPSIEASGRLALDTKVGNRLLLTCPPSEQGEGCRSQDEDRERDREWPGFEK